MWLVQFSGGSRICRLGGPVMWPLLKQGATSPSVAANECALAQVGLWDRRWGQILNRGGTAPSVSHMEPTLVQFAFEPGPAVDQALHVIVLHARIKAVRPSPPVAKKLSKSSRIFAVVC